MQYKLTITVNVGKGTNVSQSLVSYHIIKVGRGTTVTASLILEVGRGSIMTAVTHSPPASQVGDSNP